MLCSLHPLGEIQKALTDKRYWLEYYFGEMFHKKLITTHRKDLLVGDYLIDDRLKNGAMSLKVNY